MSRSNVISLIIKCLLCLVLLLPLVFTPFTAYPWNFGKTIIFQIIVELLLVAYLIKSLFNNVSAESNVGCQMSGVKCNLWSNVQCLLKFFNYLDWSIVAFVLILLITSIFGVNFENSFWGNQARSQGIFTLFHFVLFYFLVKDFFIKNKEEFKNFSAISVATAVIASLTLFFQSSLPSDWQSVAGGGIIGNRAFLASYLLINIGLAAYLLLSVKSKMFQPKAGPCPPAGAAPLAENVKCFLVGFSVLIMLSALVVAGSRGSFIGLLAGLIIGLINWLSKSGASLFKKRAVIILAIFLILISGGYSVLRGGVADQSLVFRLFDFSQYISGTGETRLMAWNSAWQGIKEKPLLGWGWGNYNVVFDKYYNPEFLKHTFAETVWDKPHNWLLEIGVSSGLIAVVGYLLIVFIAGYYLLRKNSDLGKIILAATLIAYFVQDLFLFESINGLILWFVILAYVSSQIYPSEAKEGVSPIFRSIRLIRVIRSIIISVILLILFISLYFTAFIPLKYSYYLRQAELSSSWDQWLANANKALSKPVYFSGESAIFLAEQLTRFDKAGQVNNNPRIQQTALKITEVLSSYSQKYPANLAYPSWLGQFYLVLGENFDPKYFNQAEAVFLKAVEISPRKQETMIFLARTYLLKNETEKALVLQRRVVEVAPDVAESHWFLGLTLVASGDRKAGLREIEKAIELRYSLSKDSKIYVLDLYALEGDYQKLISEYKKLTEAEPANVDWYIKLAVAYALAGDKKNALDAINVVVAMDPMLQSEADKFIEQHNLK